MGYRHPSWVPREGWGAFARTPISKTFVGRSANRPHEAIIVGWAAGAVDPEAVLLRGGPFPFFN